MDPLSEHVCETAATGRVRHGTGNGATATRHLPPDRLQLDQLREELQRGVRLTQDQQARLDDDHDNNNQFDDDAMPSSSFAYAHRGGVEHAHPHARRMRSSPVFADDEAENDEIAAFLGLAISTDSQDIPRHLMPSLSAGSRSRMVPCSPPVPIPPKHRLRRNSMSTTAAPRVPSGSTLIPSHEHQYSRTQCEARLWDEYWNYKLSLESRESFEASTSNNQRDGRESPRPGHKITSTSINQDQRAKRRATSEASTEDTAQDSGDEFAGDAVEVDVFDMDDL